MPRKVFVSGEILTASDVNTQLMDQTVMVFDDATARTTAIPTPVEGMVTYLKTDDEVTVFDGSAFKAVGPGKILQVVSTAKTDTFTTSSATFTVVTGLTASITPSSTTSKILVIVQLAYGQAENNAGYGHFKITGGNAGTYIGDAGSNRVRAVFGGFTNADNRNQVFSGAITFLDSPSTTSATTYQVECRRGLAGSVFVNRSAAEADSAEITRGASSITLMEVAG